MPPLLPRLAVVIDNVTGNNEDGSVTSAMATGCVTRGLQTPTVGCNIRLLLALMVIKAGWVNELVLSMAPGQRDHAGASGGNSRKRAVETCDED
jgi:hypothetical protein